jgi:hypothetical protein
VADFVFNIAKGRVGELYNRVDTNDGANSALLVVVLATANLEGDATLKDYDTLEDILAAANDEVTNTNYARKTLTDADLGAISVDDTNDRFDYDISDQTWTSVAAGDGWSKLLICYDPDTTGGTDTTVVPLTAHDFVVTPNGSNITAQVNASGFFRAS